ncbi:MAG: hypothetical protein AAGL98_01175 [Planctomycetota bacterium]
MNYTTNQQTVDAVITVAKHAAVEMGPRDFLDTMYGLTRDAIDTRPGDWCVRFQFGPVSLWQRLDGGPREFRRPPNRWAMPYRVNRWPIALARDLWGRLTGKWARRGDDTNTQTRKNK